MFHNYSDKIVIKDELSFDTKISNILNNFDKLCQDIYHTLIQRKPGLQEINTVITNTQQKVNEIIFEKSTPLFKGFIFAWQLIIQLLQKILQLQQNKEDFRDLLQQDYQITIESQNTTNKKKNLQLTEPNSTFHFVKPNTKVKSLNDLKQKIQLKSYNLDKVATQILESLKSQASTRLLSKNSTSQEKDMQSQSKHSNQKERIDNLLQKCFNQKKNLQVLVNPPCVKNSPKLFSLLNKVKKQQIQIQSDSQEDIADLKVRQHTKSQSLVVYNTYNFDYQNEKSSPERKVKAKYITISPEVSIHEKPQHRKSLSYIKQQALHSTHRSVKSAHLQEHKTKLFNIKETQLEALSNIHSKKVSLDQDELLLTQRQQTESRFSGLLQK